MRYTNKQLVDVLIDAVRDGQDVEKLTDALVQLLASQGELHRVRDLGQTMEQIWKQRFGVATITIDTPYALPAVLTKKLQALAEGAELKEHIDPTLIGGARIRTDDRIIDGSLSGALQNLKTTLLN